MELLIEITTVENPAVLDPFCGSATTLVAALRLNRHYIGFEKEEKYYNSALNRINEEECTIKSMLFETRV
jgi:site-specific DNA-methyltransferase (adenine-specific)